MAKDEGLRMPSPSGGLVKYFDEYDTKIELEPKLVIAISLILIFGVALLHFINPLGF